MKNTDNANDLSGTYIKGANDPDDLVVFTGSVEKQRAAMKELNRLGIYHFQGDAVMPEADLFHYFGSVIIRLKGVVPDSPAPPYYCLSKRKTEKELNRNGRLQRVVPTPSAALAYIKLSK